MTPADHSREIAEPVPHAQLVILPEAGHLVMLEHYDVVTDHLRDLVERHCARRPRMPDPAAAASAATWDRWSACCAPASPATSW